MRGDRLRLSDILDAIAIIQRDVPPTRDEFDADPPIKSHILLHTQIIGEAASRLSQALRDQHPQVPWRPIMRMRNIITHVYFGIDWNEVWQVAVRDIPALKPQIEAILATLPPDPSA
jgi:uncharacterized protein with HEPN domain